MLRDYYSVNVPRALPKRRRLVPARMVVSLIVITYLMLKIKIKVKTIIC